MAKRGIGQIVTDLEQQLNRDFNALIGLTVGELSSKQFSPIDTGFFASSWKASTQRPQAKDKKTEPWSKYDRGSNKGTIQPRYPIPAFNYKKHRLYMLAIPLNMLCRLLLRLNQMLLCLSRAK